MTGVEAQRWYPWLCCGALEASILWAHACAVIARIFCNIYWLWEHVSSDGSVLCPQLYPRNTSFLMPEISLGHDTVQHPPALCFICAIQDGHGHFHCVKHHFLPPLCAQPPSEARLLIPAHKPPWQMSAQCYTGTALVSISSVNLNASSGFCQKSDRHYGKLIHILKTLFSQRHYFSA